MHLHRFIAYLGMGAGAALGTVLAAGPSVADATSPIDTWVYAGSPGGPNTLPGELVSTTAPGSPVENPFTFDYEPVGGQPVPWYQADIATTGSTIQTTVTKILDPSFGYPSAGTVADHTVVNIPLSFTSQPPDVFNLYTDNSISDPNLGSGDYTSYFNGSWTNFYVSDKAGVEDQMSFGGGQPFTVFDIPASGSSTGAAEELGGGLQQLLTDLTGGASGADLF